MKDILKSEKPMFGICLGHQLLALANGIGTIKMFNGHRGLNHPVKNIIKDHCEVTSQNHGFGVVADDVRNSDIQLLPRNVPSAGRSISILFLYNMQSLPQKREAFLIH